MLYIVGISAALSSLLKQASLPGYTDTQYQDYNKDKEKPLVIGRFGALLTAFTCFFLGFSTLSLGITFAVFAFAHRLA